MVNLILPEGKPVPGTTLSISASNGVGLYMFSVQINGKTKTFVQGKSEVCVEIPEDAKGEMRIKVMDNKRDVDTRIFLFD